MGAQIASAFPLFPFLFCFFFPFFFFFFLLRTQHCMATAWRFWGRDKTAYVTVDVTAYVILRTPPRLHHTRITADYQGAPRTSESASRTPHNVHRTRPLSTIHP